MDQVKPEKLLAYAIAMLCICMYYHKVRRCA